jgi:hypothetical protein
MTPAAAPVVVLAYARPLHLQRTVESLLSNAEAADTELHVFCDAPRRPADEAGVQQVRRFVQSLTGFRRVHRVFREQNLGLARSVIDGVTQVVATDGRAIVVEDDLVVSPHFLRFMNAALTAYAHDERVASVHGYVCPVGQPLPSTFFLQGADCWGWATWSRAWSCFEQDGARLLQQIELRGLTAAFDLDGAYPFTRMLRDQVRGKNSSWAIRWHASCYLRGLLTLYPGHSLVDNIGNDASGTHCLATDAFAQQVSSRPVDIEPIPIEPSPVARQAFATFLRRQRSPLQRALSLVRRAMGQPT